MGEENNLQTREFWETATYDDVDEAIKQGGDVNKYLFSQPTPLYLAIECNQGPDVVGLLIDAGADMEKCGKDKVRMLHVAAQYNQKPEVSELLIDKGSDIEALTRYKYTPLLMAARYNKNPKVSELLINKGANKKARTKNKYDVLILALKYNPNPEVANLLIDRGVETTNTDEFGKPPLDLAGEREIMKNSIVYTKLKDLPSQPIKKPRGKKKSQRVDIGGKPDNPIPPEEEE